MYCGSIIPKMVKNKRDLNVRCSPHKTVRVTRRSASKLAEKLSSNSTTACANIKVVVRVRPPNQKELGTNSRTIINVVDENVLIFDPKKNEEPFYYHGVAQRGRDLLKKANKNIQFNFDRVFGYDNNNEDVFKDSTKNLIVSLMDGYNCSVFVYGATGAGKTHTMLGHNGNPGITLLTMQELFRQMQELKDERDFELGITYLEVYNETVKDLLNPGCPLHLREDGKFGVCVPGIELKRIFNAEELFALLEKGNCNRTQHPTDANAESSRSHAVFQVYVNTVMRKTGQRRISKLSMIDLAGSERGAATGCKGARFTEGANINKSLLALGNCINSLADGRAHVPYRDSKLTRLLKDSLGGNCQTVMIANISPSSLNYEDTYNTLKYATRAKKIKSNMKKNDVSNDLTIPQYKKLVDELNKEVDSLKMKLKTMEETLSANNVIVDSTEKIIPPTEEIVVKCSRDENTNEEKILSDKKSIKDQKWRTTLRLLLKEKLNILMQMQKLKYTEQQLHYKIKLKENNNHLFKDFCRDDELLEHGQIRLNNTVSKFQRQWRDVSDTLDDLKKQKSLVESKLNDLISQENILPDDKDILQNIIDINARYLELQNEHALKVIELFQNENQQKEKFVSRVADKLTTYHQLLDGHGHLTERMDDSFKNLIRSSNGVRSVTFQEDESITCIKSKDSGISVNGCSISTMQTSPPKLNCSFTQESNNTPPKRSSVKRKLYPQSSQDSDSNQSSSLLNETITIKSCINADVINSTFCLQEKGPVPKKKTVLSDRSNTVCAENLLPKVHKNGISLNKKSTFQNERNFKINNKYYTSTITKTQRFPIRKTETNKQTGKDNIERTKYFRPSFY